MERRERIDDREEALRMILDDLQARLWTAIPGVIESFNADDCTAVVNPAIRARVRQPDNSIEDVDLPQLLDCPVVFPGGGGFTLTFPIAQGDDCLVVFAARCIDGWWQSGGIQAQIELRMHDLSDGFVIPKPRTKAAPLSNLSTTRPQLRNDAGDTFLEVTEDQRLILVAPDGVEVQGDLRVTGEVTAMGTHTLSAHHHTGVQTGGGNTGGPVG